MHHREIGTGADILAVHHPGDLHRGGLRHNVLPQEWRDNHRVIRRFVREDYLTIHRFVLLLDDQLTDNLS